MASKSRKPSTDELMALLRPQSESIQSIQAFREAKRTSKLFNHLSAISESIPALGWIAVAPTPGPHVKEMADACQFYTNRVLMEYKNLDKTHVEWTRSWLAVLAQLQAYIKQYHTTGLSWNPKGDSAAAVAKATGDSYAITSRSHNVHPHLPQLGCRRPHRLLLLITCSAKQYPPVAMEIPELLYLLRSIRVRISLRA